MNSTHPTGSRCHRPGTSLAAVPVLGEACRGGFVVGAVALHLLDRPAPDLADLSGADVRSRRVDDPQLDIAPGLPDRAQELGPRATGVVVIRPQDGDPPTAHGLHGGRRDLLGDRRGAVDHPPASRSRRHRCWESVAGTAARPARGGRWSLRAAESERVWPPGPHHAAAHTSHRCTAQRPPTRAAGDAEQRHGHEVHAVPVEEPLVVGSGKHLEEVPVGQLHPLGSPMVPEV